MIIRTEAEYRRLRCPQTRKNCMGEKCALFESMNYIYGYSPMLRGSRFFRHKKGRCTLGRR